MRICKDCQFYDRVAVQMQGRPTLVPVCRHRECQDPVDGEPIPCQAARTNDAFCGLKAARHFLKKEETQVEEGNVIQLTT